MITLQKAIEDIVQFHIHEMTGQKQQRRALHLNNAFLETLSSLYDEDEDAVAFVNHFGHIEYQNRAFYRFLMLDQDLAFSNIFNLDRVKVELNLDGEDLTAKYPRGLVKHFIFKHHLVSIQKTNLLKLTFKDQTAIFSASKTLDDYKRTVNHYLQHTTTPMFLLNYEGIIQHVPIHTNYLGKPLENVQNENVFEVLPYDYAKELMNKVHNITPKVNGNFMYQTENDRMVKMYDTTVKQLDKNLYLSQLIDVSDLNTMSSTIEYLNSYDSLTGFYNTNYYENILSSFKNLGHLPMGVYTLNLQGLKQVNIRQGHHKTDNLLIDIALNIKSLISQHEIACRISGDTFVIFFPNCSPDTLEAFKIKMAGHIEKYRVTYKNYYITYSSKQAYITSGTTSISHIIKGLMT